LVYLYSNSVTFYSFTHGQYFSVQLNCAVPEAKQYEGMLPTAKEIQIWNDLYFTLLTIHSFRVWNDCTRPVKN